MIKKMGHALYRSRILIRHFTLRYINNDALLFDRQRRVNLIALFSLLAVATGFFSHQLLRLYLFGLKPDPLQIWQEKAYFLTVMMGLVGILFTIMWDNLSPDHRDYLTLTPLPLGFSTIIFSKLASMVVLVGLTTLIFNIFSTLIFSFYLTRRLNLHPLSIGTVHLATHFLAYLFIFLFIACIQGIIRSFCHIKWYRHLSTMIQTAFLTLFIILLIWFPSIYPLLPSLKASHSPLMYLFPPFWFVGLGETMIGRVDSTFSVYGHIITVAFVLPFGLYLLSMPRFFRKFLKTKQTPRYSLKPSKIKAFFKKEFDNLILKNSLERGSFYFSLKTLNRCKKNKMHLLTFLIIPAILISIGLTILYLRFDASFFRTINIFLVALPLVLIFFLIWGMRMTITHAVHPPANWIFVLKSSRENNFFLTGVKKAFVFSMILPLLVSLFFIYLYLWNLPAATGHTFFCLACAILLMSLVFIHYPQIPFINPPPSNGRMYTFFFLTGFLGFSYLFSLLGLFLLKNPEYYILFYLSVALAFFLLKWIDYTAQGKLTFTYDKLLDRVMIHLEQDTPDKKSIH